MDPFSDSGDNSFVVQLKEVKYAKGQRQPQKFPDPGAVGIPVMEVDLVDIEITVMQYDCLLFMTVSAFYQLQMYYVCSQQFVKEGSKNVFGPDKKTCI